MLSDEVNDTPISSLPAEWSSAPLESLVGTLNGLWTGKKPPFRSARVIRNTNFNNDGTLDLSNVATLNVQENQFASRQLLKGDIILERSGGGPSQPVGRVVYFDLDATDFSLSNFTTLLRVIKESYIDSLYLLYYLLHFYRDGCTNALQSRTTGIRNLNFRDYMRISIPLPPLPEQRAIAHVLITVRQSIEATERVITASHELKRSMMKYLITYGPVPINRVDQVVLKETEIGEVPEGWKVERLGDIAKIERGKFTHRPRNDPRYYGGSIPFIQTGDVAQAGSHINTYTQTLNEVGLSVSKIFPKGTILITIAANIGYTGILEFDSAFPDSLIGITPYEPITNTYLEYFLQTQRAQMDKTAPKGTQKNINIQFLKPWLVKLPPTSAQRTISQAIETIENKILVEEKRKSAVEILFNSLLHHLMTGKVRVSI